MKCDNSTVSKKTWLPYLTQEWCDRVITTIQNKQKRRNVRHKVKQLSLPSAVNTPLYQSMARNVMHIQCNYMHYNGAYIEVVTNSLGKLRCPSVPSSTERVKDTYKAINTQISVN